MILMLAGFHLVEHTFVRKQERHPLSEAEIEECVMEVFFHYYDNASNGNRTRGGMKKASDLYGHHESIKALKFS
jgi:protein transport protein SEC39